METVMFLAVLVCLAAVIWWYIENDLAGAEGERGVFAIAAAMTATAAAGEADAPPARYTLKAARGARPAAISDAARVRARVEAARIAGVANREPDAAAAPRRYRAQTGRAYASSALNPRHRMREDRRTVGATAADAASLEAMLS